MKEYYNLIIDYIKQYQKFFNENKQERIMFINVRGAKKLAQSKITEVFEFFRKFAKTNEFFGLLYENKKKKPSQL